MKSLRLIIYQKILGIKNDFDELNKLRVLEPEVSQSTGELKDECHEFVSSKSCVSCESVFLFPPVS